MATVMLVDDNPIPRDALARVLRKEGYDTVAAEDGVQALERLRDWTPDLILLDVMMPQMDGLGMLEALQADPRLKCIPVVMLTARSDTHTIRRAEQLGAKAYLIKASHSVAEVLENVRNYTSRAETKVDHTR